MHNSSPLYFAFILLLFGLGTTSLFAQRTCVAHEIHQQRMENDPAYAKKKSDQEYKIQQYLRNRTAESRAQLCATNIVVPIAVHYQEAANPDVDCLIELAEDQIRILNEDFQGTNADLDLWTNGSAANFPGVSNGEFCVEFVLATRNHPPGFGLSDGDPAVTINTSNGDFDGAWANYFNIFVRSIGALGYVTQIGSDGLGDGMTISNEAFGSAPNCSGFAPASPFNLGRTLTHELGHYLNLRHIWGDGGCGVDDGVADTPTSGSSNFGCPGPTNSDCGSLDMHMNYMDYTNDACMYMFSAGQADRMEAHFMTSLTNVIDNGDNTIGPAIPRVQFARASLTQSEGTSSCNGAGERVIPIEIKISDPPSVTASLAIFTAGSAVNGVDYSLSPNSVTFPAGTEESQFVNLTIFEDAEEEGEENINLSFFLNANGGDAVVGNISSQTITITNDDSAPQANEATTLLEQDFTDGIGDWTIIDGGTLGETWKLSTSSGGLDGTQYLISDSDAPGNGSTTDEMFISPVFDGSRVTDLTLSLDQHIRTYNQGGNETFDIDVFNGNSWINVYNRTEAQGNLGGFGSPNQLTLDISAFAHPLNQVRFHYQAGWDWYWVIDNIQVTGTSNDDVQMDENSVLGFAEQDFGPQSTIHFFDQETGLAMLSLTNNSNHDYGCTMVEVEKGAGDNPGTFPSASEEARFLTDKMYRVSPETNNPSGSYSVTLYYDAQEIDGWVQGSGELIDDLVMVKGESPLVTALLLERAESTVRGSFGNNYTFTADFNTGFSSFALGGASASLPVEFGRIAATASERSIFVDWSTLTEFNSEGFEVLRSTDNQRGFDVIGWLDGQGTSERAVDYRYEDHTAVTGQLYYYQLRQLDFDRSEQYSSIVSAEIEGKGPRVDVFPNPADGAVTLEVAVQTAGNYRLIHTDGRVVLDRTFTAGFSRQLLDLSSQPAGVYYLTVETAGERLVKKVVKR